MTKFLAILLLIFLIKYWWPIKKLVCLWDGGIVGVEQHEEDRYYYKWTRQDGTSVLVAEMTDSHLRNIIFFLNKRLGELLALRGQFGEDLSDEGDTGFTKVIHRTPEEQWEIYPVLLKEADYRKLKWTNTTR